MELLIPGLVLVAVMVWASTKIKKSAAEAYAEETVTSDRFTITKPEDLIIPMNADSPFLFEARTKEHETIRGDSVPASVVSIGERKGESFDAVCDQIRSAAAKIVDEDHHREGARVCLITAEEPEGETTYSVSYKVVEAANSVLVLRARTLPEQSEDLLRKIDSMVRSFSAN